MGIMQKAVPLDALHAAILRTAQAMEKRESQRRSLMAALDKVDQQFNAGSAHPPRFLPDA